MFPFTMTFADGEKFECDSCRAKKLLLLFYSTSCPHCRTEIINLDSLYGIFSNELDVIGVCVDRFPGGAGWGDSIVPSFPVVVRNGFDLARSFKITAVPLLYCIDEGRVLRYRSSGENTFHADSLLVAEFVGFH